MDRKREGREVALPKRNPPPATKYRIGGSVPIERQIERVAARVRIVASYIERMVRCGLRDERNLKIAELREWVAVLQTLKHSARRGSAGVNHHAQ